MRPDPADADAGPVEVTVEGRAELLAAADVAAKHVAIPQQRRPPTGPQRPAAVPSARATGRRRHATVRLAGVLLTLVASAGTLSLLRAEQAGRPRAPSTPSAAPADTSTPSGQGRAAAQQILARGGIVSIYSCEAAYERAAGTGQDAADASTGAVPTMSADERAYVDACLGSA